MYMAFTENDASKIRKCGMSVIEFKRLVRNMIKSLTPVISDSVNKMCEELRKTLIVKE